MAKPRRILTNFSKGELSPNLEGRPDLAAYFEGCQTLENWLLLRQGGITRRPGTRFVAEVKNSSQDTILIPFEFSVDDAFVIEVGVGYCRFYKNGQRLTYAGSEVPVEVTNPYAAADLRNIHYTQSADVLFLFHPDHPQQRLSRVSDTNWSLSPISYQTPPSFEADTDVSGAATITPATLTGNGVIFTASAAVFLEGDVGRIIIHGAARAIITAFGASAGDTASPNDHVRADILDAFTSGALSGWLLRLSPQAALDPDKKEPVGAQVTLVADKPAFRSVDVNKYVIIYGGLVKITTFDSVTQLKGTIQSVMSVTDANPAASPAGAWTLEEISWSLANGYPRTGEFSQGRLTQASTKKQPTTFWMSASDDFDNYAIGTKADNAIEYTIAARRVNRVEWIADHGGLFLGTAGAEFKADSGKTGEPFGGDIVPAIRKVSSEGSAPIQPIVTSDRLLFIDRSRRKIFALAFDFAEDSYKAIEVTGIADHITGE